MGKLALKKVMAWKYYFDPGSPTFMNALRSLVKAGYSYNYARSYGTKIWDMRDFANTIAFIFQGKRNKRSEENYNAKRTN